MTNSANLEAAIWEALKTVVDADTQKNVVELGLIQNLALNTLGGARFDIVLSDPNHPDKAELQKACESVVKAVEGVTSATGILARPAKADHAGHNHGPKGMPQKKQPIPGIRNIVAVSSGKGGVGKTTTAVNLACALQKRGYKVGILDADIYGPNVPLMMGLQGQRVSEMTEDNKMKPPESHGVKIMSMAFLVKDDQPVSWRGPMLDKVIRQFFTDTGWDGVDYLLVDLPPGTGDAQITIIEAVPLQGAVIVTTPQAVAILDSKKGLSMFQKANVDVLGVVENMSYLPQANGENMYLFGQGGGPELAEALNVPFLGEVPINPEVCKYADAGQPIVIGDENCPQAQAFFSIADKLVASVLAQREQESLSGADEKNLASV